MEYQPAAAPPGLLELGRGGLLLEKDVFARMRDTSGGFVRGLVFVALVGLIVGAASLIGSLLTVAITPSPDQVWDVVERGVRAMPFYDQIGGTAARAQVDELLRQQRQIQSLLAPSIAGGGLGLLLAPIGALLGWLIYGVFAHIVARMLGGTASLGQTLAVLAPGNAPQLLAVPAAIVGGTTGGAAVMLFGLLASYVGLKLAHSLPPWRAFWATVAVPLVLTFLAMLLLCLLFFAAQSITGGV